MTRDECADAIQLLLAVAVLVVLWASVGLAEVGLADVGLADVARELIKLRAAGVRER